MISLESHLTENIVEVQGISKRFGATTVLDNITLDIRRGEFLSLLGPSGCGKTTLLRIIAGFEYPSEGRLLIAGKDMAGQAAYSRSTNMIFQQLALFPHMTVTQNIAFGLRMKKIDASNIKVKVGEMIDLIQLKGYENRMPDQLSGGQRQRVALARALINSPDVLLLDEPLGALDLQLRIQLQAELRRLQKAIGNTFIFVTHDQTEAIMMSDRIAVLNKGAIVQLGKPQDIYEKPQAKFVATFVGQTNLFDAHVEEIDLAGHCLVSLANGSVMMRCTSSDTQLIKGQLVTVAIRFEKVKLTSISENSKFLNEGFHGTVQECIYMGGHMRYLIIGDGGIELTADLSVSDELPVLGINSMVNVNWSFENAIVLVD